MSAPLFVVLVIAYIAGGFGLSALADRIEEGDGHETVRELVAMPINFVAAILFLAGVIFSVWAFIALLGWAWTGVGWLYQLFT